MHFIYIDIFFIKNICMLQSDSTSIIHDFLKSSALILQALKRGFCIVWRKGLSVILS